MTARITFHDLTLGYERHPAVHHLDGTVEEGALLAHDPEEFVTLLRHLLGNPIARNRLAASAQGVVTRLGGAVEILDRLLHRMGGHQLKKTPTLRALLSWAEATDGAG